MNNLFWDEFVLKINNQESSLHKAHKKFPFFKRNKGNISVRFNPGHINISHKHYPERFIIKYNFIVNGKATKIEFAIQDCEKCSKEQLYKLLENSILTILRAKDDLMLDIDNIL